MAFILNTLLTAAPLLIPAVILLIARVVGFKWAGQRLAFRVSLALYAVSLVLLGLHANALEGGAAAFFMAFYGQPETTTVYAYAAWSTQIFAIIALMMTVNWDVVRLYTNRKEVRAEAEAAAKAALEAEKAKKKASEGK